MNRQAMSGHCDRGAGRRIPTLSACGAPTSLALTGTAAASGLAATGRGEEDGGAEGHADGTRGLHAHTAGPLPKLSPGDWTSRVCRKHWPLDSLFFLAEEDQRSLGTRLCVLRRSRQAAKEHTVHGCFSSSFRERGLLSADPVLPSHHTPRVTCIRYRQGGAYRGFPDEHSSEGRRHFSCTQAGNPYHSSLRSREGTGENPPGSEKIRRLRKKM